MFSAGTKVHVISKYFGWHYPKPLWVFIRDKVILGEIYDANPPLLQRIVERCVLGFV
jgi:hypothetical protein